MPGSTAAGVTFRLAGELELLADDGKSGGARSIGWVLALDGKFVVGGRLLAVSRSCETLEEAVGVLKAAHRLRPGGPI